MRRAGSVISAGLLLTLAAFVFDAAPLFVVGIGFMIIGIGTPVWVWRAARSATVRRRLIADRVTELEPVEAIIEVRRGRLGLPGAEVHDPLAHDPVVLRGPLTLLTGERSADIRVVARFERRGLRRLRPPALVVRDALSLVSILRPGSGQAQEVLVLPRTERVRWTGQERGRRVEGADLGSTDEPLAAVDIDGLRPYRLGTPASRIQWSALARGAGLLERRLKADGEARPVVVLDARHSRGVPVEDLDAAVRAAASLTLELARRGGCRLLLPGDRRPIVVESDLRGWDTLHTRLALLEGGPNAPTAAVTDTLAGGPMFYVAAQAPGRLPSPLTRSRGALRALVLPISQTGDRQAPSFEVSGCQGFILRAGSRRTVERAA
jgi:uncharacterized protein (DUF58 family)